MNKYIHTVRDFHDAHALSELESGKVIFLPHWHYKSSHLTEALLSENILDGRHKNVSYDILKDRIGGLKKDVELENLLRPFMKGYAIFAKELVDSLCPHYQKTLIWGRTSYRPAEIKGRASSKRKDDTRLHVDSFAATPVNGKRILRVFCNINPSGQPRQWHLGEPFPDVLARFEKQIPSYSPFKARLLKWFKITKSLRSAYDHHQLQLHDRMKLDDKYQQSVHKLQTDFPALSTWMVYTDQVSHAALGGQFLLEQTFYLPADAMQNISSSPFWHWEQLKIYRSINH